VFARHSASRWLCAQRLAVALRGFCAQRANLVLAGAALAFWWMACPTTASEDRALAGQGVGSQQPEPPSPRAKPEVGACLIASRTLTDPNFRESVVLLIEHTASGTAGLIVNRATKVPVSAALPQIPELAEEKDIIHIGGPVALESITLLVKTKHQMHRAKPVVNDIYLTASESVLRELVKSDRPHTALRYYAGHTGWGPGQLEFELKQGSWYLLSVDTDLIVERKAEDLWPELIRHAESVWAGAASKTLGLAQPPSRARSEHFLAHAP
jgi:putative transcriptional regulator